jgi:glutathione S-transferase
MEWVAVVTALALVEYVIFGMQTGIARGRYEVPAPAMTGHPVFERTYRVQANTLEQLVVFLPGLWLFASYVSSGVAALLGVLFLVGRVLYARGYVQDPARRGPGFLLGAAATWSLVLGGLVGALLQAL